MTITEADEEGYQSAVSDFIPQIQADACYPTAIKNILDALAERKEIDGLTMSLSEIGDLCHYREGLYTEEDIIPEALTREISGFGYQAVEAQAPQMDWAELESIINADGTSRPIVELDPKYFEAVANYTVQGKIEPSHTVIVFKVNDDSVLYYDPYEKFFERSSRIDEAPYTLDRTKFYELWSGDYDPRWTFWIERSERSLLEEFR